MKIYNKVIINIKSGEVLYEDSYEYDGPLSQVKGGSTSTTSIDYAYNQVMADISERQQDMAEEYFQFWQDEYKEMESMQIEANKYLMPAQVDLQMESYKQALRGLDPELIETEARHDVGIAFAEADDATRRELGRMGIDPTSKKAMGAMASGGLDKAKTLAASMKDTLTMTKQGGKYQSGSTGGGGVPTGGGTSTGTSGGFGGVWQARLDAEEAERVAAAEAAEEKRLADIASGKAAEDERLAAIEKLRIDTYGGFISPTGHDVGSPVYNTQYNFSGAGRAPGTPIYKPTATQDRMNGGGR